MIRRVFLKLLPFCGVSSASIAVAKMPVLPTIDPKDIYCEDCEDETIQIHVCMKKVLPIIMEHPTTRAWIEQAVRETLIKSSVQCS